MSEQEEPNNVVTLIGTELPKAGEPDPVFIEFVSEYFEAAQRGEIKAIAISVLDPGGGISTNWIGVPHSNLELYMAINLLQKRYETFQFEGAL